MSMSGVCQGEFRQWLLRVTGIAEHQELEPLTLVALKDVPGLCLGMRRTSIAPTERWAITPGAK